MTNPNQTNTFYVIYNTATDQYRSEDGGWGAYAEAKRFLPYTYAGGVRPRIDANERFVGPCVEGETP